MKFLQEINSFRTSITQCEFQNFYAPKSMNCLNTTFNNCNFYNCEKIAYGSTNNGVDFHQLQNVINISNCNLDNFANNYYYFPYLKTATLTSYNIALNAPNLTSSMSVGRNLKDWYVPNMLSLTCYGNSVQNVRAGTLTLNKTMSVISNCGNISLTGKAPQTVLDSRIKSSNSHTSYGSFTSTKNLINCQLGNGVYFINANFENVENSGFYEGFNIMTFREYKGTELPRFYNMFSVNNSYMLAFMNCKNLTTISSDIMNEMFSVPVKDYQGMFANCNNLSNQTIENIISAILTIENVHANIKNLSNANIKSPFSYTKFNNSYYTNYHSQLTAKGFVY